MIDPHWDVVDLDPGTWRAIGEFILPVRYVRATDPDEHALFVLHHAGRPLTLFDSQRGRLTDLDVTTLSNPAAMAKELYATGLWDRVHVIDRAHLQRVAHIAQDRLGRDLPLDAYYHRVFHLVWDEPGGYVVIPDRAPGWNGFTYTTVRERAAAITDLASVGLGVLAGHEVVIGLLAVLREGMIRKVTTFEALDPSALPREVSTAAADGLWVGMAERLGPPAGLLLCTEETFRRWIDDEDKFSTLCRAVTAGEAVIRQRRADPPFPELAVTER